MKVVADSSPKIGQFDLLRRLFGSVIVPAEVYAEVVVAGAGLAGALETSSASWIEMRHVKDRSALAAAYERFGPGLQKMDLGELSVLVLAKEIGADLLLADDLAARRLARAEGFRVQGTVGIVEASFTRGYLKDLRGAFGELLTRGVFLDPAFLNARLSLLNLPPLSNS